MRLDRRWGQAASNGSPNGSNLSGPDGRTQMALSGGPAQMASPKISLHIVRSTCKCCASVERRIHTMCRRPARRRCWHPSTHGGNCTPSMVQPVGPHDPPWLHVPPSQQCSPARAVRHGIAGSIPKTASRGTVVGRIAGLIDFAAIGFGGRSADAIQAAIVDAGIISQAILCLAGADVRRRRCSGRHRAFRRCKSRDRRSRRPRCSIGLV